MFNVLRKIMSSLNKRPFDKTAGLPKSFERIQAAATSNILHIPQLSGGDRVSSI